MSSSRSTHTEALLGADVYTRVRETKILVVGAGGIGCELLKNLVLVGFANIEIASLIDLDTIDLSNLNRQFLFRKPDISKPKALVAAASARHFNPSSGIEIHARHGNVKDSVNDLEWIKRFGLVMNALDNMDARRHVNKLCQAAKVPLIESGTAGYLGQVTPFVNASPLSICARGDLEPGAIAADHIHSQGQTECFDCVPKPAPKSFPVCTIRSTPSEPIHCIVWGKTYLFNKLFGEDDEDVESEELDKAKADGENADEIENLRKEAAAFRGVRKGLGEEDGPQKVFRKVFNEDIKRLLAMEDMWKKEGRVKPVPLDYEKIMDGSFEVPPLRTVTAPAAQAGAQATQTNGSVNGGGKQANGSSAGLKDQRELSLKENLELFIDSCQRLAARAIKYPDTPLSFDKDDDDTLDFVLATANLRATAYGIANKTRFQVKEMAGNIIPAIATTNAIIAGLIVMQSLALLSRTADTKPALRNVFLRSDATKPLGHSAPAVPDEKCSVCRDIYVPLKVDPSRLTLGQFVDQIARGWLGDAEGLKDEEEDVEWTVYEGGRLLADPDFEDNLERTLEDLDVKGGKTLTVRDEDGKFRPVHFCLCELDPNTSDPFSLPPSPPRIPLAPAPPPASPSRESSGSPVLLPTPLPDTSVSHTAQTAPIASATSTAVKRGAPDDGDVKEEEGKRRRVEVDIDAPIVVDVDNDDEFEIL